MRSGQGLAFVIPFLGSLAACSNGEIVGCKNDSGCPAGHVCLSGSCEKLCELSSDCPRGYNCNDGVCSTGASSASLRIDALSGNGSANCPDTASGSCFADALLVTGVGLAEASFTLAGLEGADDYALALQTTATDTRATLALPTDLLPGRYLLTAVNGAAQAQVDVQILRGEPGPDMTGDELVTVINNEATLSFEIGLMPAANSLITLLNSGTTKLVPGILPPGSGGTNYTGNDIVDLVNGNATTPINADKLGTGDTLMARINQATTTLLAQNRLPVGNDVIARINQADGSVKLSSTVLPPGGTSDGNSVVGLINAAGTTSKIDSARLNVGTTSGTVAAGDHTHSGSGGAASYYLQRAAGTAGAAAAVDDTQFTALCGDNDGCTIMLGYRYYNDPGWGVSPATLWGPPCHVQLNANRNWAVSPWCLQRYETNSGSAVNDTNTHPSQPYGSYGWGTDNNVSDCGAWCSVLTYYANGIDACVLADGPNSTDNQAGFYFWMTSTANTAFADANRTCDLLIQD